MSASDPALNAGAAVDVRLTVDGRAFDADRLVSVETWSEADRIPRARLVFFEGPDEEGKDFPLSGGNALLPGARIVVSAGYGGSVKAIHTGVIVRHSVRIDPGSAPQLVVETADELVKMTLGRSSSVSEEKSDKDVIAALVSAAGGTVGRNQAATAPHEAFVQYHASAWDTLLLRAQAGGCLVFVDAGKVDVVAPAASGTPAVTLEYGDDIVALEATLDAAAPFAQAAVKSRSWSYADQALVEGSPSGGGVAAPGDFGADRLAAVFATDPLTQQTAGSLDETALAAWSGAALTRSRLAAVRGTVRFQGSAAVKPGGFIALKGVGGRFEGTAFVTAVSHVFNGGSWQTSASFGLARETLGSGLSDVAQPAAARLVPPIRGLHIGQVMEVAPDPAGHWRVKVSMPLVGEGSGIWARLSSFYASSGFGAVFAPEVGDEVVLGFMDEDPQFPVVLGSLYSSARKPKDDTGLTQPNDIKAIVSRTRLEVRFDDKDTVLTVKTPGGRVVRLDDKKGEIEITDASKNSILMDKDKVDVTSAAVLNLTSKTDFNISAGAKLTVAAKGAYSLNAASIEEIAKGLLTIESNGPGKLKSKAPLTILGAMVSINPPGGG
jgi:uncharacterized protein involved in type VI secretion and phage assembly